MVAKKILVVDDDRGTLRLIEQTLAAEGYQTILTVNGEQAIREAQKEIPDLLIVDIVLPDLDGPEVARTLRDIPATRDIPVLFISSIVADEDDPGVDPKIKAGGLFYEAISKPFTHGEFVSKVKRMFD